MSQLQTLYSLKSHVPNGSTLRNHCPLSNAWIAPRPPKYIHYMNSTFRPGPAASSHTRSHCLDMQNLGVYMNTYICTRVYLPEMPREPHQYIRPPKFKPARSSVNVEETAGLIRKRKEKQPVPCVRASRLGPKQDIASHRQSVLLWSTSGVPGRLSWISFKALAWIALRHAFP